MKKYKAHWSLFNLVQQTQAEVVKLQQIAKALFGTLTVGTYFSEASGYAIFIGFFAMLIDLVIGCIFLEEIKE